MSTSNQLIQNRLARIEGQIRGLVHMVEEEREAIDVLTQVAALRAALDSVGSILLANHVEEIAGSSGLSPERLESLRLLLDRFLK